MKLSFGIALLFVSAIASFGQASTPRMVSAEPGNGKVGDEIAVSGENLDKTVVAKVYLTDGKNDFEVPITEQSGTTLKFKIPDKATGRLALMVLTAGKEAKLIEQPVKVQIDN